ncbi:MAG TPA: RNA polymerase sigma-70 factor [Bacteroides sp.]|nr:RNA polymerase sigma-70 factor [Bacteroides sp.]
MERTVEQLMVRELSNGSINAFNALYKQYCNRLFRFSFSMLKNQNGAEEAVQHVFLKVWEKRASLNPELSFQGYIFKITKNYVFKLINDSLREKNQFGEPNANSDSHMENISSVLIYSETKSKVRKVIEDLPSQRKKVYIMSRKFNLTNKEIAEELFISVNTVKRHMNLALKTLYQAVYS